MIKKFIVLISFVAIAGCAGRSANPVNMHQPGDRDIDCHEIESMLSEIDSNIKKLLPKCEKTGKNVVLGVAGAFFIAPWFFMDFSDAEKTEVEAYRSRYNHLTRLYNRKGCGKRELVPALGIKEEAKK
tara:strand:- start:44822 stop:45205 length:384 start_codon:yes stop_codon:yes gene_type:complete